MDYGAKLAFTNNNSNDHQFRDLFAYLTLPIAVRAVLPKELSLQF